MYIIRDIFIAKPGQASKLAKLFKQSLAGGPKARVMTDMVGPYNTVIMETEMESLADWEMLMADYKSGKMMEGVDSKVAEEMSRYTEMYDRGWREIFQIIE